MKKQFKLIKEYPGSPALGYISIAKFEDGFSHYWSGNWFEPRLFPEYWEEVKEVEKLCVPFGTKFVTGRDMKTIYTVESREDTNIYVDIQWKGRRVSYNIEAANQYFSDGTWKVYIEKPVLFVTEDGVEIREGDTLQEYIDMNKPIYSKKQALEMLRRFDYGQTEMMLSDDEYVEFLI